MPVLDLHATTGPWSALLRAADHRTSHGGGPRTSPDQSGPVGPALIECLCPDSSMSVLPVPPGPSESLDDQAHNHPSAKEAESA